MKYIKHVPHPALHPYVECLFVWQVDNQSQEILIDSPPAGFSAIVFNLGAAYKMAKHDEKPHVIRSSFIAGQSTANYQLFVQESLYQVGIVFKPTGLFRLFGIPGFEVSNSRFPLADLSDSYFKNLENKIVSIETPELQLIYIEKSLIKRLSNLGVSPDQLDLFVNKIVRQGGNIKISELLKDTYMSRRKFERRFLHAVGLSPKYYARLRRYGYICSLFSGKREADWDEILFQAGYYDQSHFIKDFKEFSGLSPSKYLQKNQELSHQL